MKILAIEHERPGIGRGQFAPHLAPEARQVWELYRQGVVREVYFCHERSAAVLLLEAESSEAARRALATLPLVRQELIEFEILELSPYTGYARLFADPDQALERPESAPRG